MVNIVWHSNGTFSGLVSETDSLEAHRSEITALDGELAPLMAEHMRQYDDVVHTPENSERHYARMRDRIPFIRAAIAERLIISKRIAKHKKPDAIRDPQRELHVRQNWERSFNQHGALKHLDCVLEILFHESREAQRRILSVTE